MINANVLVYPPLGGLSHNFYSLEVALFNKFLTVVKLGGEGDLGVINISTG